MDPCNGQGSGGENVPEGQLELHNRSQMKEMTLNHIDVMGKCQEERMCWKAS